MYNAVSRLRALPPSRARRAAPPGEDLVRSFWDADGVMGRAGPSPQPLLPSHGTSALTGSSHDVLPRLRVAFP